MSTSTLRNTRLKQLKKHIPDLPRAQQAAAKYIIDNPSDFGLDAIRETASKAGVSTYTLIRLAEGMGLDNYETLRAPFRQSLVMATDDMARQHWLEMLAQHGEQGRVQADAAANAINSVQQSLKQLDFSTIQRVVALLTSAEHVYLTAVRSSYAVAFYLHYVGRMVLPSLRLIPQQMTSAIDDLNGATADDVLIAITTTPYSRETIEACQFARRKGMKVVLISDSEIVSPDFQADATLLAETQSTHHFTGYSGMMAVIETLLAMLVAQGGEAATQRIQSYDKLREENNAYWSEQKR